MAIETLMIQRDPITDIVAITKDLHDIQETFYHDTWLTIFRAREQWK